MESLFFAIEENKIDETIRILETEIDVNSSDKFGYTGLLYASKLGHSEIAKILLEKGANTSTALRCGRTPLILAAEGGFIETIQVLLDYGAEVNQVLGNIGTCLSAAAYAEQIETVEFLLHKGADVNIVSANGNTALTYSATNIEETITRKLLEHGANINHVNYYGISALIMASENGNRNIAKLLLNHKADTNIKSSENITALMSAAQSGNKDLVVDLIENGANIDEVSKNGMNALAFATRSGNTDVISVLSKQGEKLTTTTSGLTPLMLAAIGGSAELAIKILANNGSNIINDIDQDGTTALMFAAENGHHEFTKILIDHEAKIDLCKKSGWNALLLAAKNGHTSTVKLLLEKGANHTLKAQYTASFLDALNISYIENYKSGLKSHKEVIKLLLNHSETVNPKMEDGQTVLNVASKIGCKNTISRLVKLGLDINLQNKNGQTPTMIATENSQLEALYTLLSYGANTNIYDRWGSNALVYAVDNQYSTILLVKFGSILLQEYTNLTLKTLRKFTWWSETHTAILLGKRLPRTYRKDDITSEHYLSPLNLAISYKKFDAIETLISLNPEYDKNSCLRYATEINNYSLVEYFLERGADPRDKNELGQSSLKISYINRNDSIIRLLQENIKKNKNAKTIQKFLKISIFNKRKPIIFSETSKANKKAKHTHK